jgi:hypothetical protein
MTGIRSKVVIAGVAALALAGCSAPSAATADRAVCQAANANGDTMTPVSGESSATPSLSHLVAAFNAAVSAAVRANNTPGDIGGAFAADGAGINAYYAMTGWCQSHGYGGSRT